MNLSTIGSESASIATALTVFIFYFLGFIQNYRCGLLWQFEEMGQGLDYTRRGKRPRKRKKIQYEMEYKIHTIQVRSGQVSHDIVTYLVCL